MRKILVCQHVPYEPLGTLNPMFKEQGFRIRYVNFGRDPKEKPCLDSYQGLVILGGPMGVDDIDRYPHLEHEISLVHRALDRRIPILGICLGSQLIAKALGAIVKPNPTREIGWYQVEKTSAASTDPLMQYFNPTEKIFQWHQDTFTLPPGAVHLAQTSTCPVQAFRYEEKTYGFQFHLEVDEPMIERWLNIPFNREILEKEKERVDPNRIRQDTALHIEQLKCLSQKVFGEFIRLFGPQKKFVFLPSR